MVEYAIRIIENQMRRIVNYENPRRRGTQSCLILGIKVIAIYYNPGPLLPLSSYLIHVPDGRMKILLIRVMMIDLDQIHSRLLNFLSKIQ